MVAVLYIERKYCSRCDCTLYSSLIIVISLQLRGRRQIAEPHKYCIVHVIVFLWRVFSLFFVSHMLGIRFNSLYKISSLCLTPSVKVLAYMYNGEVPMSPYTIPML